MRAECHFGLDYLLSSLQDERQAGMIFPSDDRRIPRVNWASTYTHERRLPFLRIPHE
jgi:hypothetical protein